MRDIEHAAKETFQEYGVIRSRRVARRAGVDTAKARRELIKLQKRGVIEFHPRYSSVNCSAWVFPIDASKGEAK